LFLGLPLATLLFGGQNLRLVGYQVNLQHPLDDLLLGAPLRKLIDNTIQAI